MAEYIKIMNAFGNIIKTGDIHATISFYNNNKTTINSNIDYEYYWIFRIACYNNYLNICIWLHETFPSINIHVCYDTLLDMLVLMVI